MTVKFEKAFCKNWFIFPLAIDWYVKPMMFKATAKIISVHFMWWHCQWKFIKEGGE